MSGGCCSIARWLVRQTNDDASQRFRGCATSTIFKAIVAFIVWIIHRPPGKYLNPNATADRYSWLLSFSSFLAPVAQSDFRTHADEAEPGQH